MVDVKMPQKELKSYLSRQDFNYDNSPLETTNELYMIYDLFINNIIPKSLIFKDGTMNLYLGFYYYLEKNYEEMEYYYKVAIDLGNTEAHKYYGFYKYMNMNPKERKRIDKEAVSKESIKMLEKNPYSMRAIENAIYYYTNVECNDHMAKKLKLKLDALCGDTMAMVEYAKQCKYDDKTNEMIHFYNMVIKYGKTTYIGQVICEMTNYYLEKKDYVKAREYITHDTTFSCKECINGYLSIIFDISIAANYRTLLNDANLKKLEKNLEHYKHPSKIDIDITSLDDFKEECYICCENSYPIILSCDHKVCMSCYPNISNRKCPYCREAI